MTPVFCCGFGCGVTGPHITLGAGASFDTTIFRSGSRSIRINTSGGQASFFLSFLPSAAAIHVFRVYIRFVVLPTASCNLATVNVNGTSYAGVYFNQSDSSIYAGTGTATLGSSGVAVTTGIWYCLDLKLNLTNNPWLIDGLVNGIALGQATNALAGTTASPSIILGNEGTNSTFDINFADLCISTTGADYPIGEGSVLAFLPTSDGTHSITTAFKVGTSVTDINNATTTAYTRVNSQPVIKAATASLGIAQVENAPVSDQYAEVAFGPKMLNAPNAVEVLCSANAASGNPANGAWKLNDNGTVNLINTFTTPGTAGVYATKQYATAPSTSAAWTATLFNNIKARFGYSTDANPDIYGNTIIIEANFPYPFNSSQYSVRQAVKRSSYR